MDSMAQSNHPLLWPLAVLLYTTELEVVRLDYIPWVQLCSAALLSLGKTLSPKKDRLTDLQVNSDRQTDRHTNK